MTLRAGTQVIIRDLSAYRGRVGTLLLDQGPFKLSGRYIVQVGGETIYCTKVKMGLQPFLAQVTYTTGELQ